MRLTAIFVFTTFATHAYAAPTVVVDIAPLHGLVSEVMADIATPTLLLPPQADTHSYAMRPSDAQVLSQADVVFWIGEGLTPWLLNPLDTLAPEAQRVSMLDTQGWTPRALDDDHGHGTVDPHAWLDPKVATIWLDHIAAELTIADPENGSVYARNAANAAGQFDALSSQIEAVLAPAAGQKLIWPHDAYGYFADAFALTTVSAIAHGDASDPGPAHIAELRDLVVSGQATCVLSDPEINQKWAQVLIDGTDVKTAAIDPIGAGITLGTGFYATLMLQLSQAIAKCAVK